MDKKWIAPEITALNVKETAGGRDKLGFDFNWDGRLTISDILVDRPKSGEDS